MPRWVLQAGRLPGQNRKPGRGPDPVGVGQQSGEPFHSRESRQPRWEGQDARCPGIQAGCGWREHPVGVIRVRQAVNSPVAAVGLEAGAGELDPQSLVQSGRRDLFVQGWWGRKGPTTGRWRPRQMHGPSISLVTRRSSSESIPPIPGRGKLAPVRSSARLPATRWIGPGPRLISRPESRCANRGCG